MDIKKLIIDYHLLGTICADRARELAKARGNTSFVDYEYCGINFNDDNTICVEFEDFFGGERDFYTFIVTHEEVDMLHDEWLAYLDKTRIDIQKEIQRKKDEEAAKKKLAKETRANITNRIQKEKLYFKLKEELGY